MAWNLETAPVYAWQSDRGLVLKNTHLPPLEWDLWFMSLAQLSMSNSGCVPSGRHVSEAWQCWWQRCSNQAYSLLKTATASLIKALSITSTVCDTFTTNYVMLWVPERDSVKLNFIIQCFVFLCYCNRFFQFKQQLANMHECMTNATC